MESRILDVKASDNRPQFGHQSKYIQQSILRDNFSILTWLLCGASVQALLSLLLPLPYALLPVYVLLYRSLVSVLGSFGLLRNNQLRGVIPGKFSVQIPDRSERLPEQQSAECVAVILLGTRSNHPLGILAPGYKDVGQYMNSMVEELEKSADKYGYLGQTTWIEASGRAANNQLMFACYFRSAEDIHRYAHSSLHRNAWTWWNSITKTHPYLSIMHEVYEAPKGHWENIYINNQLVGLSGTSARVQTKSSDARVPPIIDGTRGSMRSHMGRIGRSDGTDNDVYGPEPY